MHTRIESDCVTAATVNREGAFFKCIFSRAVDWDILDSNPLQRLRLLPESCKRDVYLGFTEKRI